MSMGGAGSGSGAHSGSGAGTAARSGSHSGSDSSGIDEPIWTYGGTRARGDGSGAGGVTRVDEEDMERAVSLLILAGADLDSAAQALGVAARVAGDSFALAAVAQWRLWEAAAGSSRESAEVEDLAQDLAAARSVLGGAERATQRGVAATESVGEVLHDVADTTWWGVRWAGALATMATASGALWTLLDRGGGPLRTIAPGGLPATTAVLNQATVTAALAPAEKHIDDAARALAQLLLLAEAGESPMQGVTPEPGARRIALRGPGLEGVIDRLAWLQGVGGGAVAVETLVAPDGTRRHVVYIPGTQDWGVWDSNPADLQANLASVTGDMSDAARTVVGALDAHGIARGEEVMLAGHSQGGMVAMVAASALASHYRITQVVTAGSPTGRLRLPAGVHAMHLENPRDLVPALDGKANPSGPRQTTVVHDRRRSLAQGVPDASLTITQAHGMDGYSATARQVDHGVDAYTRGWQEQAGPFLGGGASTLAVYRPATG